MLQNEVWQIVSAIAAAVGTLVAAVALIMTVRTQNRQQELTKSIHEQQTLLQQRQLLLPLWNFLERTAHIDPANPVWEDVRNNSNTLELVAICWEGNLIDPNVLRRGFGDTFIEIYETVDQCQNPPANLPYSGRALLRRSPATQRLYDELRKENIEHGRIPSIQEQRKAQ